MRFSFHPEALREYKDAALWYEEQRNQLGVEFTEAVKEAIEVALKNPTRFQPVDDQVRILRLKRFPYHLFFRYREAAQHIQFIAVMHNRRRPDYWRRRADGTSPSH